MDQLYVVTTWDTETQSFTPQDGVSEGPYATKWELKRALRELQRLGYSCDRGDCSVLVEKWNAPTYFAEIARGLLSEEAHAVAPAAPGGAQSAD